MEADNINFDSDDGVRRSKKGLWPEIENLGVSDLMALRSQIDSKLPERELKDLNLEEELVAHFVLVKEMMTDVMDNEEVPLNQKAQLANSCASLLTQMAKVQTELYNAERIKKMEQALIEALKDMGDDVITKFFGIYEELLDRAIPDE